MMSHIDKPYQRYLREKYMKQPYHMNKWIYGIPSPIPYGIPPNEPNEIYSGGTYIQRNMFPYPNNTNNTNGMEYLLYGLNSGQSLVLNRNEWEVFNNLSNPMDYYSKGMFNKSNNRNVQQMDGGGLVDLLKKGVSKIKRTEFYNMIEPTLRKAGIDITDTSVDVIMSIIGDKMSEEKQDKLRILLTRFGYGLVGDITGKGILTDVKKIISKGIRKINESEFSSIIKPVLGQLGNEVFNMTVDGLVDAVGSYYKMGDTEKKLIKSLIKKFGNKVIKDLTGGSLKGTLKKIKAPAKKAVSTALDVGLSAPVAGLLGTTLGSPATGAVATVGAPILRKTIKGLTGLAMNDNIGIYAGGAVPKGRKPKKAITKSTKSAGAKSAGAKSAGAKSAGAKSAGAKSAGATSAGAMSAGGRPKKVKRAIAMTPARKAHTEKMKRRGLLVKKIMKEKNLSFKDASLYVSNNKLKY